MNAIVDTSLLFDPVYMREKIREKLKIQNINECPNLSEGPIGFMTDTLSGYGIRVYLGFVNHEKRRVAGYVTPLLFYTDTNVKVYMSNICFYNGSGISISFTSDDGTIGCSASLMPGDGRLSGDLTSLANAKPYIDPAIYVDYLLCCDTPEIIDVFTKHDAVLDQVEDLKQENAQLVEKKCDLESIYEYIINENNCIIESNNIDKSTIRALTGEVEQLTQNLEEEKRKLAEMVHFCRVVILYLVVICISGFVYLSG